MILTRVIKSDNKTKNIKTLKNTNNLKMQRTALFITLLVATAYAGQLEKIFSEVPPTLFRPLIPLGY